MDIYANVKDKIHKGNELEEGCAIVTNATRHQRGCHGRKMKRIRGRRARGSYEVGA